MWKASVLVFLLLNMHLQVDGTRGKRKESEMEKTVKTQEDEIINSISEKEEKANTSSSFSGKLLVIPMDGSHWVGLKALSQELGRRGHRVTVVIPEVNLRMGPGEHYETVFYPVPYDQTLFDSIMSTQKEMLVKSTQSFIEKTGKKVTQIKKITNLIHTTAESLLFNTSLISHLAQQGFDAVLTDPMVPTGALIARKLGIPIINMLRGIPCSLDMQSAGAPSPPSYVPRFFTGYTDKMNFKERAWNSLIAILEPLMCRLLYWHFDNIAYEFLGEEVGIAEVLSESAIWLMRLDFTLELPRPLMPNIVLIGGINCNVKNPLPEDLEPWVSGEHGFIVFTLGNLMSEMPQERFSQFIEAFRQIPQKVILRYTGQFEGNIPDNVKMMSWVPQNDLLAHPGARAFITHAGSHGLFEGVCHAIPMLMVPLSGDQPDNAKKLASRGAGLVLDITEVTTEEILWGLNEILNNPSYKANVQKLSDLHRDRPIDPLDLSVYWTEFVMRHKGATHLKATVHDLNWIQYFCLDVIALLVSVVLVFLIVTIKCFKFCFCKLGRKRKQE